MKRVNLISTKIIIVFSLAFNFLAQGAMQQELLLQPEKNDGPYLLYNDNSVKIITIKYFEGNPKLKIDSMGIEELANKKIKVKPNCNMPAFSFKIFDYQPDSSFFNMPEKLLVVSDIEGNFKDFTEILIVAGAINKKYEWTYGSNHLLINGDLFDRGNDVLAFLWLCYKLDNESRLSGGRVHINLGNHDDMNLHGNTSYAVPKYLTIDSLLGIDHKMLFNEKTEIGRWLRTKNCITIIDSTLFVHGGIGIDLVDQKLNVEKINQLVRENLGNEEIQMEPIPKFLFGLYGVFWYRGLVLNTAKYRPVSTEQLNMILNYFGVQRMVVGHCIVPEIIGLHGGKVIVADVDHYDNKKEKRSRALLITNKQFYTINDDGKIKELPTVQGFSEDIKSTMKD